jgi:inhibitor of Bruton tyrosine kinase
LTWNLGGFKKYLDGAEPVIDPTGNCGHPGAGGGGGGGGGGKSKGDKASSAPKSWTLHGLSLNHGPKSKPDPNERDAFGRTVLHLVCSCPQDPRSFDFLYALLSLPTINVNVQDAESGWTALHRAMWCGNLRAAKELLSRSDTDLGIKDAEGLTAMDLYNSTCEGTNPDVDARGTDLFTWGSNSGWRH